MKIGYLRVSTEEQRPDRQIDALEPLCDQLYIEKISAIAGHRPIFEEMMMKLQPGDTLLIWDLDRAFRSTVDAIQHAESLRKRGIAFEILSLKVNTAEPAGEFANSVMAAAAQYERRMLSKRTKEGMAAAKKRGAVLGRPKKLSPCQIKEAVTKLSSGNASIRELAKDYKVHPRTLKRALKNIGLELG